MDYEVHEFDLDTGNLVRSINIPVDGIPLGAEVDDLYPYHAEAKHGGFEINETSAFIMSFACLDDKGRLWIRRIPSSFDTDRPASGEYHYDILDIAGGALVGWVRTDEMRVFAVQRDSLFGFSNTVGDQGSIAVFGIGDF